MSRTASVAASLLAGSDGEAWSIRKMLTDSLKN
ncbi:hypothetical protein ABIB73_000420 [Bradyrhizobium sp. F1.4.3]